jgi:peroxiredoxin
MQDSAPATDKPAPISGPGLATRGKSLFVLPFLLATGAMAVHAALELATTGFHPAWFGALVAAGSIHVFLAWAMASGTARTSPDVPALWISSMLGAAIAIAGQLAGPVPTASLYGVLAASGTLAYVFWYSRFGRRPSPVLARDGYLPAFALEDTDGHTIASQSIVDRPTVLLFYRGNWCPLCLAQVREVAAAYREIAARGAQVVLVSPQPHEKSEELARHFDVPMRFLVDPDARAARRLGIAHLGGLPFGMQALGYEADTVLPTVVIVDGDGRVLQADQTDNYRVRPEPETFLAALADARVKPA